MGRVRVMPGRIRTRDTRAVTPPPKVAAPIYNSPEWRRLIGTLIRLRGRRCEAAGCGRRWDADGKPIRVFGDHVVELRDGGAPLDPDNVRLLCGSCHTKKTIGERARRAFATD